MLTQVVRNLVIICLFVLGDMVPMGGTSAVHGADLLFSDRASKTNSDENQEQRDDIASPSCGSSSAPIPIVQTTSEIRGCLTSTLDSRDRGDNPFHNGLPLLISTSFQSSDSELPPPTSLAPRLYDQTNGGRHNSQMRQDTCASDENCTTRPNSFSQFYADPSDFHSCEQDFAWHLGGLGRGYYRNDQRYEFTGAEQTFGVEGVIDGGVQRIEGDWTFLFESQFFLNQPYDRNILTGTPELDSFKANFQVDPFQISLLTLSARKNNFLVEVGRFVTPFGRFYYPIYSNNFWDSPFIRSDAILYRETGALLQWDPEPFIVTAAITNGGLGLDTNSSKALIARAGLYGDSYAIGTSVKWQDGIGSEWQKECNSHLGIDAMYRRGQWTLSAEAIVDYYGMNRPGFDPNNITWGRSVYFRDISQTVAHPLVGYGYYMNLGYAGDGWAWNFNYGDYLPQKVGDPRQDTPIHRALIKGTRHVTRHLDIFTVTMIENSVEIIPGHSRDGFGLLVGFQYTL